MTDTPTPIRVFIVEDHDIVRRGIRDSLEGHADVVVVGQADEEPAAIELIPQRKPDVVLLDLNLKYGHGRRVVEALHPDHPEIRFLVFTVSAAPGDVISVIRAGARGYLTKDVPADVLIEKIRDVHGGGAVISPQLAAFAIEAFDAEPPSSFDPEADILSPRERETATLIAKGYTNRQIGYELNISVKTVEKHVSAVLLKLSLTNRSQVTRWVLEHPDLSSEAERAPSPPPPADAEIRRPERRTDG